MDGDFSELTKYLDKRFSKIDKRFDKVNQRFDRIDKRFSKVDQRLDKVDQRFDRIDKRFSKIDKRFDKVNQRFDRIDKRFSKVDQRFDRLFDVFATKEDLKEAVRNLSTKEDFNKLSTAVDDYAQKADSYFQEMVMLSHKVDRHEKWIRQIADKLNIKLKE